MVGVLGIAFPYISIDYLGDSGYLTTLAQTRELPYDNLFIDAPRASQSLSLVSPINPERPNIPNRLVIPKAKINMPLFESAKADVLLKGGWIFPRTSLPGKMSNTVIFGHRFRYMPPISNTFYNLDKVAVGDMFSITWKGTLFTYKITDKRIIDPANLSVFLESSDDSRITLITCAPLFSTKQRLIVIGTLQ